MSTLLDLKPGQKGRIARIGPASLLKHRLAELGFVQGSVVTVERKGPFGDPRSYSLRGYHISLRNAEARHIFMEGAE